MSVDPVESLRLSEEEARQETMACYSDTGTEQAQRFYQRRMYDIFMSRTRQPTLTTDYKAKYEKLQKAYIKQIDQTQDVIDKYMALADKYSDLVDKHTELKKG